MNFMPTRRAVLRTSLGLALAGAVMPLPSWADDTAGLTGAGSTFGEPLYRAWAKAVGGAVPGGFQYGGVGSLEGINRFQSGLVDIGASDVPMNNEQITATKGGGTDVLHLPTAYGGIVITYNLPGFNKRLNLTGAQLAAIYLGQIQWWSDPQLVANNPDLASHKYRIITFHRADGSGTTYGFTSFLSASSKLWLDQLGTDFAIYWPVGDSRGGNGLLVDAVKSNANSIGYTELSFALKTELPTAAIQNSTGRFVPPTLATISAAVQAAGASTTGGDLRLGLINGPGDNSYPISTGTYVMFHQHQPNTAKAQALTEFLLYAVHEGQSIEPGLFYVALPGNVVTKAEAVIRTIR